MNLIAFNLDEFVDYNLQKEKSIEFFFNGETKRNPKFISNLCCDKLSVDNCIFENADFSEGIFKEICEKSLTKKLDDYEIRENNKELLVKKDFQYLTQLLKL